MSSTSGAIEFLDNSIEVRMPSVVFCEFGIKGCAENVALSDGADDFSCIRPVCSARQFDSGFQLKFLAIFSRFVAFHVLIENSFTFLPVKSIYHARHNNIFTPWNLCLSSCRTTAACRHGIAMTLPSTYMPGPTDKIAGARMKTPGYKYIRRCVIVRSPLQGEF